MRTRDPDLDARWRERVEAWRSSGRGAAQFAAQNGFSTSALTGWSSKLRLRPAPRPSAPAFVAVVRKDVAPVRELVVEVAGARVKQGFDPALLAAVVRAIGGASRSPRRAGLRRDRSCRFALRVRPSRGLRSIAIGRKKWLVCGSNDDATANLFSLVASCPLHGLDTELYLREVIHVLPQWPRDRVLELCPRDWARTRGRLVASALECGFGPIMVPPAEEQS
jgi:hypothetical protein